MLQLFEILYFHRNEPTKRQRLVIVCKGFASALIKIASIVLHVQKYISVNWHKQKPSVSTVHCVLASCPGLRAVDFKKTFPQCRNCLGIRGTTR